MNEHERWAITLWLRHILTFDEIFQSQGEAALHGESPEFQEAIDAILATFSEAETEVPPLFRRFVLIAMFAMIQMLRDLNSMPFQGPKPQP